MIALLLLSLAGCALATAVLLCRAEALGTEVDRAVAAGSAADREAIGRVLRGHLARDLPRAADGRGLAGLPARAREAHDRERTARDLLERLVAKDPTRPQDHEARIKAAYQLAYTLDLPPADTDRLLDPLRLRLVGADWMGRKVAATERIQEGAAIDREIMWPLTTGTRVRRVLGVVVRDEEGKVLSRARVLCG